MTSERCIEVLEAVKGMFALFTMIDKESPVSALGKDYNYAADVAIDAIKLLDERLNIEKGGDKGD